MKNLRKSKNAFTLLELLISIIILGIVMTSFPIIFQTMTNANSATLKEEVFFEEFSMLSLINSRYFDENNTKDDNFYKDLNATGGSDALKNVAFSKFVGLGRIGKAQFNNNIFRSGSTYTTSTIGRDGSGEVLSDTSTLDDIDDFDGYSKEFLNEYNITVSVKYIDDNATYSSPTSQTISFEYNYTKNANNTNIKLITVNCQVGDTNITLRYPTCNIGASKFLSLEEITR